MSQNVKRLSVSAVMIAISATISFICNLIPFLNPPFGGTITIASMLPLIVLSYMYGPVWGFGTGFVYSLVRMAIGYTTVSALFLPGDNQVAVWKALLICFMDYVLAYTVMGLGGIFRNIKKKVSALVWGSFVAISVRYLIHIISGAVFYGEWAEWFFSDEFLTESIGKYLLNHLSGPSLSLVYSAIYNGIYMIPEIIITMTMALAVSRIKNIKKYEIE